MTDCMNDVHTRKKSLAGKRMEDDRTRSNSRSCLILDCVHRGLEFVEMAFLVSIYWIC